MSEFNESQPERFISQLTQSTIALILAGGRGGQLYSMTEWRAEPAIPFGGLFRIIDFPLSNCINSGIRKVGVLTQYKAESLITHIQQGWSFLRGEFDEFIHLMPAQQTAQGGGWYQGTADALYQNIDMLRRYDSKYVLILAGDHIYKMDYGVMLADHVKQDADLTIACLEVSLDEAKDMGVMTINESRQVQNFVEKPVNPPSIPDKPDKTLASMGIYVFNKEFLIEQLLKDIDTPGSNRDFGLDIIPSVVNRYRVNAYPFLNLQGEQIYWRDIGSLDAYWLANIDLINVSPELNLYDKTWPIWTYQLQNAPAKFVFDEDDRRGEAIDSMVSGGCIISGATVRHSLIYSDVRVNSYSIVKDSVILPEVDIGRNCRINKAIIEKGCHVPEGTIIGEDRIEDEKRFQISSGGVVLVTPEMLGQQRHMNFA